MTSNITKVQRVNRRNAKNNVGKNKNGLQRKTGPDNPSVGGNIPVNTLSGQNVLSTCNKMTAISVPLGPKPVADFCWAVVSYALSLGYMTYAASSSDPYQAYVQLAIVVTGALTNTVPVTQKIWAPVGKIIDYLRPQIVKVGDAEIVFTFSAQYDPTVLPPVYNMGPSGGRTGNMYIPTSTQINGLLPQCVAPVPFTSPAGVAAYNSLMSFLSSKGNEMELVDFVNHMKRPNASAYAFTSSHIGGSSSETGAISMVAELETFLDDPRLAVWCPQSFNALNKTRCGVRSVETSGSPSTLVCEKMQNTLNPSIHNKTAQRFMPVDFYQIAECVATWMEEVANLAANDFQNSTLPISNYLMSLTGQEFLILLRQVMISMFADSVIATQTIFPSSSNGNPSPFLPFVASANTGPLGEIGKGFRLPQDFYENICSLLERRQRHKNGYEYVPVLGVFEDFDFDPSRFKVTRGELSNNLFVDPDAAGFESNANTKVVAKEKPKVKVGESPVSLVDGSIGSGNFVQLNAPYTYQTYLERYDEWLNEVTPFSSVVGTSSKDGGSILLNVSGDFNLIKVASQLEHEKFKKEHNLPDRLKIRSGKVATYSPYDSWLVLATAFNTQPLEVVQAITEDWVRPCYVAINNNFVDETTNLQKLQTWNRALFSAIGQDGLDQQTIAQKAKRMAIRNARTRDTAESMADNLYKNMANTGEGGIIGALLQTVGGALGKVLPF